MGRIHWNSFFSSIFSLLFSVILESYRYLAVDLTHVLSMSEGIISATLGHNGMEEYLPQVQILFLFSLDHEMPAHFRILPGAVNSVASLKLTMEESGAKRMVLVADTGFYSSSNTSALDSMGIFHVIPLKGRGTSSSRIIPYSTGNMPLATVPCTPSGTIS
ncbi:MAG: hypothetical protein M1151_03890 [Candidatus Thermoplasmatota archaeon]|jgi:transposase|nr:hypothetical protein [Candidatus Thermoplasmatota archaeon]MCL5785797.1 hypothetical protein [Candidatus Thermoplasmatota archaeon]